MGGKAVMQIMARTPGQPHRVGKSGSFCSGLPRFWLQRVKTENKRSLGQLLPPPLNGRPQRDRNRSQAALEGNEVALPHSAWCYCRRCGVDIQHICEQVTEGGTKCPGPGPGSSAPPGALQVVHSSGIKLRMLIQSQLSSLDTALECA